MNGQSSTERLKLSPLPVDRVAARVAFGKGEHFTPEFPEHHAFRTMKLPPKRPQMPSDATDYAGLRHGHMTALFWFSPASKRRSGTIWVARCDCGNYELRRPGTWGNRPSPTDDPDRCEECRRTDVSLRGGSSKSKAGDRVLKWAKDMMALGLTADEICQIRATDNIETKDKTAAEIREALRASQAASEKPNSN